MAQSQGFCPDLLYHIGEIAGENAPGRKLHVAGFLQMLMCCANSSVSPLNNAFTGGHRRNLTVSYRRRPVLSDVSDEDTCDNPVQPGKLEWTVPGLRHKQYSVHIEDDLIRQYCVDASRMRSVGAPATQVMQEVYDLIVEGANVVMRAVNNDLVVSMATEFGENTTTGTPTKTININSDGTKFILDDGIVEMMQDLLENEFCGEPCIVGGGIFSNFNQAQALACCNSAGLDLGRAAIPRFFFDKDSQTIWGQNSIGIFAPGSVKMVSQNKFVGSFAGQRGTSFFTTLPLPINEFGCADDCLRDLVFDLQLRYNDCAADGLERGWQAIISKEYALWVQPTNAYQAGDPLADTNGTLKYFVGNTSYSGGAYSPYAT